MKFPKWLGTRHKKWIINVLVLLGIGGVSYYAVSDKSVDTEYHKIGWKELTTYVYTDLIE